MVASASPVSSPALPATCSEGCPFAEELHGAYEDWVWCKRAGALSRIRRVGSNCPAFQQSQADEALASSAR